MTKVSIVTGREIMIMRTAAAKYFKGKKCKRPMSLNRQDGERGWEGSVQACREGRGVRTGMCAGSGQACVCVCWVWWPGIYNRLPIIRPVGLFTAVLYDFLQ